MFLNLLLQIFRRVTFYAPMDHKVHLGILLGFTLLSLIPEADAQRCPTTCRCPIGVIDCSDRGFTELPNVTRPGTSSQLSRVDFSNNILTVLNIDKLFEFIVGLQVDELDFSSNMIAEVEGTFDAADGKDYETLNLSRNAFTEFPRNIIPVNHARVRFIIDISYNSLTELTTEMFAVGDDMTLPGFQFIATNNMISVIHPQTFQGVDLLDSIVDLRFNNLMSLSEDFAPPRGVETLRISNNPWRCDCNLRWMINFSNRLVNFTEEDPPNCETPVSVRGRPIFQLQANDFACLPFRSGPIRQNFVNMDTFVVRCPVTADPPTFDLRWDVWLPSPNGADPIQLCFNSETVGFKGLQTNPRAAFRCTASNNAGSVSIALEVLYNGQQGLEVPEDPLVPIPTQC